MILEKMFSVLFLSKDICDTSGQIILPRVIRITPL